MKLHLKPGEHLKIELDQPTLGAMLHIAQGAITIRAKSPDEPDATRTTLVIDAPAEIAK